MSSMSYHFSHIRNICPVIDCPGIDSHQPVLPLLRKVYDEIVANPEQWDQKSWARIKTVELIKDAPARDKNGRFACQRKAVLDCNSAFCVAGHAAIMSGYELYLGDMTRTSQGLHIENVTALDRHGSRLQISEVAAHELGLNVEEREQLFGAFNNMEEITRVCRLIAQRAGEEF